MPDRSTIRYTYEDYLALPESTPYRRYEIVDGELFVTPSPRFRHQEVAMNISRLLANAAVDHGLGKVVQSPVTVRLPDVIFVHAERLGIVEWRVAGHRFEIPLEEVFRG